MTLAVVHGHKDLIEFMYGGMQEFIPEGFKTRIYERTSNRKNKHDSGFYSALCFAAEKGDEEICDIIFNSNIDADLGYFKACKLAKTRRFGRLHTRIYEKYIQYKTISINKRR